MKQTLCTVSAYSLLLRAAWVSNRTFWKP
ncbi:rCG61808 [Rattus norvegicus]|uniref:RCG61808 n=1 Tax=Rattus norvegicus TaxID=10116 RepID=A6HAN2_RAT|nr:rCG61808 [Rattus norvegicus]